MEPLRAGNTALEGDDRSGSGIIEALTRSDSVLIGFMALKGQAFLALWNDIARARETEYDQWHTLEHVPERVAVTGFNGARRYVNRHRESHRYFTLYDVDALGIFDSPEYIDLLKNPTPWSASMRPDFSNFVRATCKVLGTSGTGIGAAIAVLCFESTRVDGSAVEAVLRGALEIPGITAVHWGRGEGGLPTIPWRSEPGRTAEARPFDRVAMIEGLDRDAAASALARVRVGLDLDSLPRDFGSEAYELAFVFPGPDTRERSRHRRATWAAEPNT
jgi:hypothetical protein